MKICYVLGFTIFLIQSAWAQEEPNTWDNQLYYGTKINWSNPEGSWKYSGELQFRVKENWHQLDRFYLEGIASYLYDKNWEFVPDFRITWLQDRVEYRPGLGVLYKIYPVQKFQIANQLKYQADIKSIGGVDHGVRAISFFNYSLSETLIPNLAGGIFYSWKDNGYQGIQFIRFIAGLGWIVEDKYFINFAYLLGIERTTKPNQLLGAIFIQLVINIDRDYNYLPGRIINF